MELLVFLDESGDLGFKFDAPYREGGSSRYLTMAFFVLPPQKEKLLNRLVRDFYKKYKIKPTKEKKGSSLTINQRRVIAQMIKKLLLNNPDIQLCSITVKKNKVASHIRNDSNLLYNFMMKLSVLDKVKGAATVKLIRDIKTVKVASGNSLLEYLQTSLWFEHYVQTTLADHPTDSKTNLGIMLVDWVNSIVFRNYEDKNHEAFDELGTLLKNQTLFF